VSQWQENIKENLQSYNLDEKIVQYLSGESDVDPISDLVNTEIRKLLLNLVRTDKHSGYGKHSWRNYARGFINETLGADAERTLAEKLNSFDINNYEILNEDPNNAEHTINASLLEKDTLGNFTGEIKAEFTSRDYTLA